MYLNKNYILCVFIIISIFFLNYFELYEKLQYEIGFVSHSQKLKYEMEKFFKEPIIFVGGYVSSGTTLMRSILDVHPDVKCGPELKITVEAFNSVKDLMTASHVRNFIDSADLKDKSIERALGLFGLYLFVINVPNANRICNKEPLSSKFIDMYKKVFPNSKYIYMLRDGREVAYSTINRFYGKKFTFSRFYNHLSRWNKSTTVSYDLCLKAGSGYCKVVRYEDLVTKPKETIREIAEFLNLKWTDKFLKHQDYLNKEIKLSKTEYSLYGIKNEINTKSLNNWMGKIKDYDEVKVATDIEMLRVVKYI